MLAILLHNLGGPTGQDEVRPFLERLFSDPEIIRLPLSRWLQKPLARWIARRRAPVAWENYRAIGGGSPILMWTQRQGEGLALGLREHLPGETIHVLPAFRYSPPLVREALEAARRLGATRLLSFTLYPHYSTTTTGSSEREMERSLSAMGWQPEVVRISQWFDDPGYLDCLAWRLRRCLDKLPAERRKITHVVYSAHGIPMNFVTAGDPYVRHIEATVQGIEDRVKHGLPASLAFQSRVGPWPWTQPYMRRYLPELARQGVRSVVVVPVSFVSDHVETLYEIDIELAELAHQAGIEHWARPQALNADPDFLGVLTNLAMRALSAGVPAK
jgi:ferrochelatase